MSINLSINISDGLSKTLHNIADEFNLSTSEVFRRALALLIAAHEAKQSGHHLAVVDSNNGVVFDIVGLEDP